MKITNAKTCFCFTCDIAFHYLGIATHRAMHRDRGEDCRIKYTNGNIETSYFSKLKEIRDEDKKTVTV